MQTYTIDNHDIGGRREDSPLPQFERGVPIPGSQGLSTLAHQDQETRLLPSQLAITSSRSSPQLNPESRRDIGTGPPPPSQALCSGRSQATIQEAPDHIRRKIQSSATWTISSGGWGVLDDASKMEDRWMFVEEYNRLAEKHGVRPLVPEDHEDGPTPAAERRDWLSRTLQYCRPHSRRATSSKSERRVSHRRSASDLAMRLLLHKNDYFKDEDLQSLVRLCGKSLLYLPSEYAPSSLILPTCIRATAQFLVQHAATTRGVFRIPGSIRVVNALYNYYCAETVGDGDDVAGTVRCPNLPLHINASVHDVASCFKKFLAGLPGGILGSLSLFDSLVAINSQLHGDPEFNRTKQSKLRARLIALAVGTLQSQYRRELICAVFGLLSLVGRAAEIAPREDERGRPLPTSDLMGYSALGIVFGPLLLGNLLDSYAMKLADPAAGLVLFPITPRSRKEHHHRRCKTAQESAMNMLTVDKVKVANDITEMLVTHWREVVRHMKSTGALRTQNTSPVRDPVQRPNGLRQSASEYFVSRNSRGCSTQAGPREAASVHGYPFFHSPTSSKANDPFQDVRANDIDEESLIIRRQRPSSSRSISSKRMSMKASIPLLSPPVEENSVDEIIESPDRSPLQPPVVFEPVAYGHAMQQPESIITMRLLNPQNGTTTTTSVESPAIFLTPPNRAEHSTMTPDSRISPGNDRPQYSKLDSGLPHNSGFGFRDNPDALKTPTRTPRKVKVRRARPQKAGNRLEGINFHDGETRSAKVGEKAVRESKITMQFRPKGSALTKISWPTGPPEAIPSSSSQVLVAKSTVDKGSSAARYINHGGGLRELQTPERTDVVQSSRESLDSLTRASMNIKTPGRKLVQLETGDKQGKCQVSKRRSDGSILGTVQGAHAALERDVVGVGKSQSEAGTARQSLLGVLAGSPGAAQNGGIKAAGGVKAIAALFDNASQEEAAIVSSPVQKKPNSGGDIAKDSKVLSRYTTNESPPRTGRSRRSDYTDSPQTPAAQANHFISGDSSAAMEATPKRMSPPRVPRSGHHSPSGPPQQSVKATERQTPESHSPRVLLRALPQDRQVQQQHRNLRPEGDLGSSEQSENLKGPLTLGRMTPHLEEPPIAHHISFTRPTTASLCWHSSTHDEHCQRPPCTDYPSSMASESQQAMTASPAAGNSILHAQIRTLQRLLDAKTDECAQLRRQLDTHEDLDVGTLSEQLRAAKRERKMWRERAEAAERRVAMLERFTNRLRAAQARGQEAEEDTRDDVERISSSNLTRDLDGIGAHAAAATATATTATEGDDNDISRALPVPFSSLVSVMDAKIPPQDGRAEAAEGGLESSLPPSSVHTHNSDSFTDRLRRSLMALGDSNDEVTGRGHSYEHGEAGIENEGGGGKGGDGADSGTEDEAASGDEDGPMPSDHSGGTVVVRRRKSRPAARSDMGLWMAADDMFRPPLRKSIPGELSPVGMGRVREG